MKTEILDTIENGIIRTNQDLEILFWNRWLAIHTGISQEKAVGSTFNALFPEISFELLKRKVRIALKMNSPTFISASVTKYIIPVEQHKVTKSIFRHMRQDVVISSISETDVSVVIYDVSAILEARAIIDEQMRKMEKQAKSDSLTGCHNKNMFNALLSGEIKRSIRHDHLFSLVIFDIDNFKAVNDTYGHLEGDRVLKKLASIAASIIRKSDALARWGGEEFCILLPETSLEGAAMLAEKIRIGIATHDFGITGNQHCSFGVAQFMKGIDEDSIVANADKALYHAKNNGKNQVTLFRDGQLFSELPEALE